ncbi:MAG: hypothetical protein IJF75_07210 [Clostridia bacterium]|nr:hypothetical protein [Clostridia bacterium]
MRYSILKKHFKFLIDEYGFKIAYKQRLGYTQIVYINSQVRITILGDENISILISDADSLGTCYDVTEYCEEFKTQGNYKKKALFASRWLKNKIEQVLDK